MVCNTKNGDRPRFFDHVEHENTNESIGNKYFFFTKNVKIMNKWAQFRKKSTIRIKVFKKFH